MDQKVLDYVVEKTHELMNAPSCSKEAKIEKNLWNNGGEWNVESLVSSQTSA